MSPLVPNVVRQAMYLKEIGDMDKEVSKLALQLNDAENLYSTKSRLTKLFSSVANIRKLNYNLQTNLETDLIKAVELWIPLESSLKDEVGKRAESIRMENSSLPIQIEARRGTSEYYSGDIRSLDPLNKRVSAHKKCVNDLSNYVNQSLSTLFGCLQSLEMRATTAENAINLTSTASFKLKENEVPVIAMRARDMDKKIKVLLTFTSQRVIYESIDEKTERQLLFEKPADSVNRVTKGRVGLLAGEGIYVEFKQPSESRLKLDTEGEDANLAVQYFKMITSGQIDSELKSGISVTVRERFKELTRSYVDSEEIAEADRNIGKCPECETVVRTPMKTWTMTGGLEKLELGLFDCPKCHKPFRVVLSKKKI
jgi:hypothetical protein